MIIFAHRGYHAKKIPENSLESFRAAIAHNHQAVELDVQATKDGQLVVIHDDNLKRTTNQKGKVSNLDYSELSSKRLHNNEPIPLLQAAIDVLQPIDDVNIELKSAVAVERFVNAKIRFSTDQKIYVSSAFARNLKHLKQTYPQVSLGLVIRKRNPFRLINRSLDFVSIPVIYNNVIVKWWLHRKKIDIFVYTAKPAKLDQMRGVEGVFVDY